MHHLRIQSILFLLVLISQSCVKEYQPPESAKNLGLLVVESNVSPNGGLSTVRLQRTRDLNSIAGQVTETRARVFLVSSSGSRYAFNETGNGEYTNTFNLDPTKTFTLSIQLSSGQNYSSTPQVVLQTPEMDSIFWEENQGLKIFAGTHDPSGKSRYFRWEYDETWEYNSYYESPFYQTFRCWSSNSSTNIILGATENLEGNTIKARLLLEIPDSSQKLSVRYHIRVRQSALPQDAYNFWEEIRKNGTETGGLFDPLPIQVSGNIHNDGNPNEKVIGQFYISNVVEKDIFVSNSQLADWKWNRVSEKDRCIQIFQSDLSDPNYQGLKLLAAGWYTPPGALPEPFYSLEGCVDCRLKGGTTQKPIFWP